MYPAVLSLALAIALFCGLCSSCASPPSKAPAGVLVAGRAVITSDDDGVTFAQDKAVVRLPWATVHLGFVDEVKRTINYDPWGIIGGSPLLKAPGSLEWRAPTGLVRSGTGVVLDYGDGVSLRATVKADGGNDGAFLTDLTISGGGLRVAFVRFATLVAAGEPIYGLGEFIDTVNQRGTVRAMQVEADGATEAPDNNARVPVPFFQGPSGWGVFLDTFRPIAFDVAKESSDRVTSYVDVAFAADQTVPVRVFLGASSAEVMAHFNARVGRPALPPPWATGPWFWRDESKNQAEVEADLDAIRRVGLAASGYWIDRPYATEVNTFDFEPAQFPNPRALGPRANTLGMRLAIWHVPYLNEKVEATRALVNEATVGAFYPPVSGFLLNRWGRPIDLTNERARAFWKGKLQAYADLGIEGYKLDYAEDVAPGLSAVRNEWRFSDGSDERTMHAIYTDLYHGTYAEMLPPGGGFLLVRRGYAGDQAKGVVVWPGDLDATFAMHGERAIDGAEPYVSVGGLPAAFRGGLSLAASGFPLYAADTGGYRHSPPDGELLARWAQASSLFFAMQIGNSANTVPWEFNAERGITEETLAIVRASTILFLRLHPFRWSLLTDYRAGGALPLAPLGLLDPALAQEEEEVLIGGVLLGAPILHRGIRERDVVLPKGRWLDWTALTFHEGSVHVQAALNTLPLFQRAGSIIPMARATVKTLAPAADPSVDSFANEPGRLSVRVVPGAAASFKVYDGLVLAWEDGADCTFTAQGGTGAWKGVDLEVLGDGRSVLGITADGVALGLLADDGALDASEQGFVVNGARVRVKSMARRIGVSRGP